MLEELARIECILLSCILKDKNLIPVLMEYIKASSFMVYSDIFNLIYENFPCLVDAHFIKKELPKYTYTDVLNIMESTLDSQVANFVDYIDQFIELRKQYYIKNIDINAMIERGLSADEIKNEIVRVIDYDRVKADIVKVEDTIDDIREYLTFQATTLHTGFDNLDNVMRVRSTNLIILSARPKVGKSSVAINFMHRYAKQKKKVLYFSFEMSREEISFRLLCCAAQKHINSIQMLETYRDTLKDLPISIVEAPGMSVNDIKGIIMAEKPDVVFIDQLDCIYTPTVKERYDLAVGANVISLKNICMEFKIPIFLLHQINRDGGKNDKPEMHNLKDSGVVEQKADVVLLLWRKDKDNQSELIIKVGGNRMGGEASLLYSLDTSACVLSEQGKDVADLPF